MAAGGGGTCLLSGEQKSERGATVRRKIVARLIRSRQHPSLVLPVAGRRGTAFQMRLPVFRFAHAPRHPRRFLPVGDA